ncbi:MAG: tyrosine-type recombinase/integrase [Actinobacteria bacterium]|nr:tyrosine-type recombinase/integrase [Actinomycetota bacterium]
MIDDAAAYHRLVAAFLVTCENRNTRAAYARDLATFGPAVGVSETFEAAAAPFDIATDDAARTAAERLSTLPPGWWRYWRDALPGSLASRRRRVAGIRAFCRWWSRVLDLPNPVTELRPPSDGARDQSRIEREVVALTQSEANALCAAAARGTGPLGRRTHALVELLYGCGLRASEAAGLSCSALELDDADDPYLVVVGKGGKTRAVSVPGAARDALLEYLARARPELRARDRTPRPDQARHRDVDAVFLGARGRRIGRADVWRIVREVAAAAGIDRDGRRVFPHALRHSCGTHLIQAGIDIRYVQAHLGHASPVTTEIYTHVTAAHLRDDFDRAHPRSRRDRE